MAVAVRVLLAAFLGLYWSSSRVEGAITVNYKIKSNQPPSKQLAECIIMHSCVSGQRYIRLSEPNDNVL